MSVIVMTIIPAMNYNLSWASTEILLPSEYPILGLAETHQS